MNRLCWAILAFVALAGWGLAMAFKPPGPKDRIGAIGSTDGLAPELLRAFAPDPKFFEPIPAPGPGPKDWLANHPEEGQTFDQFVHSKPNRPQGPRKILYLQPLGEFDKDKAPPLEQLRTFTAAYFMVEVKILEPLDVFKTRITTRKNQHTGKRQLLTSDLRATLAKRLPDDAFAVLGLTMEDLYPDPKWNYVFGEASLKERVGVYSFARYDPSFFGEEPGPDVKTTLLRRSCAVLAHETGHMFGIQHCIYYRCLMNGSNNLEETDGQPLHLCPVDLRKLQWNTGFDLLERDKKLLAFTKETGLVDEAAWLTRRIEVIGGNPGK